jgi:hypothetical protein
MPGGGKTRYEGTPVVVPSTGRMTASDVAMDRAILDANLEYQNAVQMARFTGRPIPDWRDWQRKNPLLAMDSGGIDTPTTPPKPLRKDMPTPPVCRMACLLVRPTTAEWINATALLWRLTPKVGRRVLASIPALVIPTCPDMLGPVEIV